MLAGIAGIVDCRTIIVAGAIISVGSGNIDTLLALTFGMGYHGTRRTSGASCTPDIDALLIKAAFFVGRSRGACRTIVVCGAIISPYSGNRDTLRVGGVSSALIVGYDIDAIGRAGAPVVSGSRYPCALLADASVIKICRQLALGVGCALGGAGPERERRVTDFVHQITDMIDRGRIIYAFLIIGAAIAIIAAFVGDASLHGNAFLVGSADIMAGLQDQNVSLDGRTASGPVANFQGYGLVACNDKGCIETSREMAGSSRETPCVCLGGAAGI